MSNPSSPISSWPDGWGDSPRSGWRDSPTWPISPLYDGLGFGSFANSSPRSPSPQRRSSSRSPSPRSSPRSRSRSPTPSPRPLPITQERGDGPRIFVISCHGVTFPDPDPSKGGDPATINPVKVDTFTSASFNHTVSTYTYNKKTCSFFDQAYTYFIPKILEGIKAQDSPPDKNALRAIITSSLCRTRDVEGPFVNDHCRFRCHQVGETMSDLYIMGSGSPMNEVVLSIDPATGMQEDVHDKFGLREIRDRVLIQGSYDITDSTYKRAIRKAERELESLHTEMLRASQPPQTSDRMAKLRQLRTQYDNKYANLKSRINFLKGATQGPKYRYNTKYQSNYVNIGGNHMIKLSDVIQIAIENGTIHPKTDFVIVQACRTFYGQLPSGYGDKSPGRNAGEVSDGGRKRTRIITRTRTSLRTKNRNNRNRNNRNKTNTKKRKRKTKTIRRK